MTTRKRSSAAVCLLLVFIALASGCGRGLSRNNAADLISQSNTFITNQSANYQPNLPRERLFLLMDNTYEGDFHRALKEVGFIDSNLELTEAGINATKGWKMDSTIKGSESYSVPLAKRELVEVTGIGEIQGQSGSFIEAKFKWRWEPINDIGKAMKLEIRVGYGSAIFRKFDDGWRLDSLSTPDAYFSN